MSNQQKKLDWKDYFDAIKGLPPRETLLLAAARFEAEVMGAGRESRSDGGNGRGATGPDADEPPKPGPPPPPSARGLPAGPMAPAAAFNQRLAVDLGCGDGRDALELLRRGWRVLAIDSHPEGISRLLARTPEDAQSRLETQVARFEDARWPECDLVNASFSIPHCDPADFPGLWARIAASIRPGGRFAGQFFGVRDSWATRPDGITRTYHTREQVESMLREGGLEAEVLDEVERPGKTAMGDPKEWHVFHVVARKR